MKNKGILSHFSIVRVSSFHLVSKQLQLKYRNFEVIKKKLYSSLIILFQNHLICPENQAEEPEPKEQGVYGSLELEPLGKKTGAGASWKKVWS